MTRMISPQCSTCGGACLWCEDAWACRACGDEWDQDHGVQYVSPAEQPEWEPVKATRRGGYDVSYVVYWRLMFGGKAAGSVARLNEAGGSATNDASTVAWRAIGYPITGASPRSNTRLGEYGNRRAAEAAVLAHWEATWREGSGSAR